jgi:hypothetical protein
MALIASDSTGTPVHEPVHGRADTTANPATHRDRGGRRTARPMLPSWPPGFSLPSGGATAHSRSRQRRTRHPDRPHHYRRGPQAGRRAAAHLAKLTARSSPENGWRSQSRAYIAERRQHRHRPDCRCVFQAAGRAASAVFPPPADSARSLLAPELGDATRQVTFPVVGVAIAAPPIVSAGWALLIGPPFAGQTPDSSFIDLWTRLAIPPAGFRVPARDACKRPTLLDMGDWRAGPRDRKGGQYLHAVNPRGRSYCGQWQASELSPDPGGVERCGSCLRVLTARRRREQADPGQPA